MTSQTRLTILGLFYKFYFTFYRNIYKPPIGKLPCSRDGTATKRASPYWRQTRRSQFDDFLNGEIEKMAKMHSRKRGNAKSNKPLTAQAPTWIRYQTKELEMIIGKLAKEGKTASEIGLILRDSYGIPSTKLILGKRIQQLLSEKKLLPELPEDLMALMRKSVMLRKHLETHKQDQTVKRGLLLTESKIKRLVKYYKEVKKIDPLWKYDPSSIKIYTE